MKPRMQALVRTLVLAATAAGLAACQTEGTGSLSLPGSSGGPAPTQSAAPPVNMAGRWLMSSPGRGQCNMTFGAASPNAAEGTIAPEGGCPGKFFTSRKWAFESGSLVIRDHNGKPLAQLSAAGPGFDGKATSGEPVALLH
jgi:hypothetical protein